MAAVPPSSPAGFLAGVDDMVFILRAHRTLRPRSFIMIFVNFENGEAIA